MSVKVVPLPEEGEIYWRALETVTHPNRKVQGATVKITPQSPPRRLKAGDFEMYGMVVNWVLQGKAEFVDGSSVQRGSCRGKAKVE